MNPLVGIIMGSQSDMEYARSASEVLHGLDVPLRLARRGMNVFPCGKVFGKGEELGWFEHGSTIIVFAPKGFALCENVCQQAIIRMGQPLMRLP